MAVGLYPRRSRAAQRRPIRPRPFAPAALAATPQTGATRGYGGVVLSAGLGEFRSFRGADVIPALERRFPEWTEWLEETRGLYIEPRETTPEEVAAYLSRLITWLEWIKPQLEQDATSADTTAISS